MSRHDRSAGSHGQIVGRGGSSREVGDPHGRAILVLEGERAGDEQIRLARPANNDPSLASTSHYPTAQALDRHAPRSVRGFCHPLPSWPKRNLSVRIVLGIENHRGCLDLYVADSRANTYRVILPSRTIPPQPGRFRRGSCSSGGRVRRTP
jgi:hypothetical protein